MAKWQRFRISIPKQYNPVERKAIANDIIEFIINRSKSGKDKNNNDFPDYTKDYLESRDFKVSGKSKTPNLTLTGDMLNNLKLISHSSGTILLGYDKSDKLINGKVEGNVIGSYGKKEANEDDARDFLGIVQEDLERILKRYPKDSGEEKKETKRKAIEIITALEVSRENI